MVVNALLDLEIISIRNIVWNTMVCPIRVTLKGKPFQGSGKWSYPLPQVVPLRATTWGWNDLTFQANYNPNSGHGCECVA